jgi:hypothetical protein
MPSDRRAVKGNLAVLQCGHLAPAKRITTGDVRENPSNIVESGKMASSSALVVRIRANAKPTG